MTPPSAHVMMRYDRRSAIEVGDANMSMSVRVLQIRDDASAESAYQPEYKIGFQRVKHDVIIHGSEVL